MLLPGICALFDPAKDDPQRYSIGYRKGDAQTKGGVWSWGSGRDMSADNSYSVEVGKGATCWR